jgi:hypothetical protein
VVADDVAAAQGLDADLAGAAGADVAVARVAGGGGQVPARRLGDRFGQPQRRARRGVLLAAVVRLDDLDVVIGAQRPRGVASTARTRARPMRPSAPRTAILVGRAIA